MTIWCGWFERTNQMHFITHTIQTSMWSLSLLPLQDAQAETQALPRPPVDPSELAPRLCHLVRGDIGYGFNLHSDRSRPGQYIRSLDPGSPADHAGLRPQDRLVEVRTWAPCINTSMHLCAQDLSQQCLWKPKNCPIHSNPTLIELFICKNVQFMNKKHEICTAFPRYLSFCLFIFLLRLIWHINHVRLFDKFRHFKYFLDSKTEAYTWGVLQRACTS